GDTADAEHARSVFLGAVALAHDPGPPATSGAVLRDLLEEVSVRVEEEGHLRRELVDRHPPPRYDLVAVRDAVHERERHLLHRVGAGVTKVGAGNGDRVEPRYLLGAELDRVGDQAERRARRPDPRAPADVLLEDVVLDRPP